MAGMAAAGVEVAVVGVAAAVMAVSFVLRRNRVREVGQGGVRMCVG